jgi:hypothetical protein
MLFRMNLAASSRSAPHPPPPRKTRKKTRQRIGLITKDAVQSTQLVESHEILLCVGYPSFRFMNVISKTCTPTHAEESLHPIAILTLLDKNKKRERDLLSAAPPPLSSVHILEGCFCACPFATSTSYSSVISPREGTWKRPARHVDVCCTDTYNIVQPLYHKSIVQYML